MKAYNHFGGEKREDKLDFSLIGQKPLKCFYTKKVNARSRKHFQGKKYERCAVLAKIKGIMQIRNRQVGINSPYICKSLICLCKAKPTEICSFIFFLSLFLFTRVGRMVTNFEISDVANSFKRVESVTKIPWWS